MQTFLPHSNFVETAQVLDDKRLHKQALEAWQILMVLTELNPEGENRKPKGWVNHPAVRMWKGFEYILVDYALAMSLEWKRRGYKTTLVDKIQKTFTTALRLGRLDSKVNKPYWTDDERLTSSHRTALLAKNYDHYKQFNWPEDTGTAPSRWDYVWPGEGDK